MKRSFLRVGVLALAGVLSLGLVATTAGAAALLTDDFTYADGDLTTVSGGAWVNHSGSGFFIQVVGGVAVLDQGASSREDVNRAHTAQGAADVTYASFKVMVPAADVISLGAGDYFAHFKNNSGSFAFPCRVYVAAPGGAGDFRFGVSGTSTGTTPIVYWASDASFDTYYTIVAKYDAANGDATVWVNPSAEGDPSITSSGGAVGDVIESYALRQGGGNTCKQRVDDLVVGQSFADVMGGGPVVPGASTVVLMILASLMLGAGALFVVRRRATVA